MYWRNLRTSHLNIYIVYFISSNKNYLSKINYLQKNQLKSKDSMGEDEYREQNVKFQSGFNQDISCNSLKW
jgi:hypothetical protein